MTRVLAGVFVCSFVLAGQVVSAQPAPALPPLPPEPPAPVARLPPSGRQAAIGASAARTKNVLQKTDTKTLIHLDPDGDNGRC